MRHEEGFYVDDDGRKWTDPHFVRRAASAPVNTDAKLLADTLFDVCSDLIARRLEPLQRRVAELEDAETRSLADAFKGPYLAGTQYERGALVQHSGSVWLCLAATTDTPPTTGWRMLLRGK